MMKISGVEVGQMMKLAAENLRGLSEENQGLREKLASYEKRERVEKIATAMEEKGLEPELSFEAKVDGLSKRDDLDVVEAAVGLSAPQMKLASVHDGDTVEVEGGVSGSQAESTFLSNLASI
jgi:phosphopantothenate synthetase